MESLPEVAARAMVRATASKLFVTAASMVEVAWVTGPLANSFSAAAALSRLGSDIGMLLHQDFEFGAGERRGAARPRHASAPFGERHRPEDFRRKTHAA